MRYLFLLAVACQFGFPPALAAEDRLPPKMRVVATWQGPFNETRIVKYADDSEGVACYVYIPVNVASSLSCRGSACSTEFQGNLGSISCVKVFDPPPPPAPSVSTKSR